MSATTFLRRRNYAGDTCKNEEFPAATFGKTVCIFRYLGVAKNTGDRTAPAMNGIMIKCHTHKCTRVVTLKNFTEGQILERTDALGKCYL